MPGRRRITNMVPINKNCWPFRPPKVCIMTHMGARLKSTAKLTGAVLIMYCKYAGLGKGLGSELPYNRSRSEDFALMERLGAVDANENSQRKKIL